MTRPQYILPFIQAGRLIHVKNGELDFGWGTVVNFMKKENPKENPLNSVPTYVVDCLLHVYNPNPGAVSYSNIIHVLKMMAKLEHNYHISSLHLKLNQPSLVNLGN